MTEIIRAENGAAFRINLAAETLAEEVTQNIMMILSTPKYSAPLNRDTGISSQTVDKPAPVAEARAIAEILDAVEKYESRAKVLKIKFERDENKGKIITELEVEINGG